MNYINLSISVFTLLAVVASAIAVLNAASSAKAANTLAKEVLTKRTQSELFSKVLLELSVIYRLITDFINNDSDDAEFSTVFDGKTAAELRPILKELEALSPKFRASFKRDASLAKILVRISSKPYIPSIDDLNLLTKIITLLENSQREELNNS